MKVKSLTAREIFDSRGEATIEVELKDGKNNIFRAEVPSGKSRGSKEAAVLPLAKIRRSEKTLAKTIAKRDFNSVQQFDSFLIAADNTLNKSKLGGNFMVGASIAFTRALSSERKQEVWQILRKEFFGREGGYSRPFLFSNLINGGMHADNDLDIQEYMVIVSNSYSPNDGVAKLIKFYKALGLFLKKEYKTSTLPIGDEGGYSINFKNNFEPISVLGRMIKHQGLSRGFSIALDAAASDFYKNGKYIFDGKRISSDKLNDLYLRYFKTAKNLLSVEDPFQEQDYYGFGLLKSELRHKLIVGDDLTVTNPYMITESARGGLVNAVIIKPNQIGTVSEACKAINAAHANGLKCIVSHRSGETEDTFIIHLAKAAEAFGLKIGSPVRERMIKFNEFMRIYGN